MALTDEPTTEDALDGLNAATRWADQNGHPALAKEIGRLYQDVGELSVD